MNHDDPIPPHVLEACLDRIYMVLAADVAVSPAVADLAGKPCPIYQTPTQDPKQ